MDLRQKMNRIEQLRRDIIELEGEHSKAEIMLDNMGVPQIKLEDGFMQIWDDGERDQLDACVKAILKRRIDIFQCQIVDKLDEVRELINDD